MDSQQQRTYIIPSTYMGLQNIGATCYMNSILQTLFMTPEFRRGIYTWQFNDTDEAEKDSIPYQLQKLFGRLQAMEFQHLDTRDLTKSFQWGVQQAFEQHDIQEFMRVLFDAIEQSLSPTDTNFIKQLYEGITLNYTRCLKCGHESTRQEHFLDYTLTLKDKYSQVYNSSIQKALQIAMKPETLNGSNQYFCEQCQCKQDAQRGSRILKAPPLMCLHINRFAFDFNMMKREKLDDYMEFPMVLNMNNYINGYDNIPNKLSEDQDPSYFEMIKPKTALKIKTAPVSKPLPFPPPPLPASQEKSNQSSQIGKQPLKKNTSSSSQTKSFLTQMRKQKNSVVEQQTIDQDILDYNKAIEVSIKSEELEQLIIELPINCGLERAQSSPDPTSRLINTNNIEDIQLKSIEEINPRPQLMVKEQDQYPQILNGKQNNKVNDSSQQPKQEIIFDRDADKKQYLDRINNISQEHSKQTDDQVKEFLKDGEHVYQLYSILNHTGGAFGGHYYAFIRSFEDGKWYCFNDASVSGLDPTDIPIRSFGGQNNSNGYMLFYRRVDQQNQFSLWGGSFNEQDLPIRVQNNIQLERQKIKEYIERGVDLEVMAHSRLVTVKIFFKLEYKTIQINSTETFEELEAQAFEKFDIKDRKNCRLRGYVAHNDMLTETYTSRSKLSISELKIKDYKTFSFEFRITDKMWQEYDSTQIDIRLTLWSNLIKNAEEKQLEKYKIQANRNWTIQELLSHAQFTLGYIQQEYLVCKRQQDYGLNLSKFLNETSEQEAKTLDDHELQDNQLLYLEPRVHMGGKLVSKWVQQFEDDTYTISIRFNHPDVVMIQQQNDEHEEQQASDEFPYEINIDSRQKLYELKSKICGVLGLKEGEVIIRRGGRAGLEIKDLMVDIELSHFVKGSSIYVERGCPLNPGEYRCILYTSQVNQDLNEDKNLYTFTEVGEFAVPGDKMLSFFKNDIVSYVNQKLGLQLDPKQTWIRERLQERLTKVYRDRPLKEQGILEKRMIAIEQTHKNQWLSNKEVMIMVRFWDQQTWQLSEKHDFVVSKNMSSLDLAKMLSPVFPFLELPNIQACRIVTIFKFSRYDLLAEDWHSLNSSEQFIGSQPLQITTDGSLLIIRDAQQQPRQLTEEEQKQFGLSQYIKNSNKTFKTTSTLVFSPVQILEKGLKITVKKKESQTDIQTPNQTPSLLDQISENNMEQEENLTKK